MSRPPEFIGTRTRDPPLSHKKHVKDVPAGQRRIGRNRGERRGGRTAASSGVSAATESHRRGHRQRAGVLRLHYLLILRDPDRPLLLSRIPDLSRTALFLGDVRDRFSDQAPGWNRDRYLRRPGRAQAGDGALLWAYGRGHPWPCANSVLRPDRHRRRYPPGDLPAESRDSPSGRSGAVYGVSGRGRIASSARVLRLGPIHDPGPGCAGGGRRCWLPAHDLAFARGPRYLGLAGSLADWHRGRALSACICGTICRRP